MGNLSSYFEELMGYTQALEAVPKPQQFDYKLNYLIKGFREMCDRFCPYKVGDRVQLSATPEIGKGSGWYGSKHFLVKGAAATVKSTDFNNGLFCFGLVFDDDSWVDTDGKVYPTETGKYIFIFSEKWLCPVMEPASSER